MSYVSVVVDVSADAIDQTFTYCVPEGMSVELGDMVRVPFGRRTLEGFVVDRPDDAPPSVAIKPLLGRVYETPVIAPDLVALAKWMQQTHHCYLIEALRLMLPAEMRGGRVSEKRVRMAAITVPYEAAQLACARAPKQQAVAECLRTAPQSIADLSARVPGAANVVAAMAKKGIVRVYEAETLRRPHTSMAGRSRDDPVLTPDQAQAADELTRALATGGGRFLLHGVTGSGKTEVYIRLIRAVLARRQTAIVLVPEIALTPQTVGWFQARFGDDAAVLHSRLSAGERYDEWRRIRDGQAHVVVGARSAVFAPLARLGAIIVDEEHETSYRSEKRPRYDAREVARRRVEMVGGVLVLGSATPSIESFMRARPGVKPENRYTLLELPKRALERPMPRVDVVDMRQELARGNNGILSAALRNALAECMRAGQQAMLLINRRGYSTFVSCRACGYVEKCDQCDVSMTYHQYDQKLRCHYCGREKDPPRICPACQRPHIRYFGGGTQKVEEAVQQAFPTVAVARMDVDTTRGKDGHEKILEAFRTGKTQILVGTQMIAKGLDFPAVTLVGVVAADMTLNWPDYRSTERTFQLITQVAGRAGRANLPGRAIVQTYDPDHYAVALAAKNDYRAFYQKEAAYRRMGLYPPFTVLLRLVVSAQDSSRPEPLATALEARMSAWIQAQGIQRDVLQVRALSAPIGKLRGETRWQVFVKMYAKGAVDAVTAYMEALASEDTPGARVEVEVNPVTMI